jgi:hypothetical protein
MGGNSDMRNAAQHEAPTEPPGPGELRRLHEALTALCDGAARSALSPQDWDYLDAGVRELAAAVGQYAFGGTLRAAELAAADAAGFERGRASVLAGRHRAPRRAQGQLWPRAVQGLALPAGLAAFRHGAAAKAVLGLGATAAVVTAGAGAYANLPDISPAPAAHHQPAALSGLSPAVAVPVTVPSRQAAYAPRHAKASPDAATASQVPAQPPSAAGTPPPAPSPVPPAAAPGTLDVQTAMCTIAAGEGCPVTFMAVSGPVQWQASASDPALSTGEDQGALAAGEPCTITVSVAPGSAAGSGIITITAGGLSEDVRVTWEAVPAI